MERPALVLDANILIRAVLAERVRRVLEAHADNVSFFIPETAYAEAEERLARMVAKHGGDPTKALASLRSIAAVGTLVGLDLDPDRHLKLKTLAEHRIRGALLDYLRHIDPLPRSGVTRRADARRNCSWRPN